MCLVMFYWMSLLVLNLCGSAPCVHRKPRFVTSNLCLNAFGAALIYSMFCSNFLGFVYLVANCLSNLVSSQLFQIAIM
jgi:hypothetical protein